MAQPSNAPAGGDEPTEAGTWWTNHYRCPCCRHQWEDEWDSQVDDDCPECGMRSISAYFSDDGSGTEEERLRQLERADAELEQEQQLEAAPRPGA